VPDGRGHDGDHQSMGERDPDEARAGHDRPGPDERQREGADKLGRAPAEDVSLHSGGAYGRRRTATSRPVGLVLDADGLGDPVDVVEVGDDLDRVVDRGVIPPRVAHAGDVLLAYGGGLVRQEHGEIAECTDPGLELRLPVVVGGVLRELVCCALGTEVVGV